MSNEETLKRIARLEQENHTLTLELKRCKDEMNDIIEEKTAHFDEFVYIISHDLKAPLRALCSLSAWLKEDFEGELGENGKKWLNRLETKALFMNAMLEGLLDFSRIGKTKPYISTLDSKAIALKAIKKLAPPEDISIRFKGEFPVINFDADHFLRLFMYLIDNGVKHRADSIGELTISYNKVDSFHRFCVSDNGPGIEEKFIGQIFKIFKTLKRNDEAGGIGLGLALAKKIARLHGGDIFVSSTVGEGSQFYFTIPQIYNIDQN